ncbi:MAG: hypothetical protein M5T61_16945 [Acidimicrobiia bacterium]|nr:hypothetical protein [Acidimicrobiia bacterium]
MSCPLDVEEPPSVVFRESDAMILVVARLGICGDDGTFGNRWDDPEGLYRVLYASSLRVGCYIETLARLRPDPAVVAALEAIEGDEPLEAGRSGARSWIERPGPLARLLLRACSQASDHSFAWLHQRLRLGHE